MTINGLPLHPLVVHATVVALPATAVLAIVYVARSFNRGRYGRPDDDRLRLPLMIMGVVSAALVWLTVSSGQDLRDSMGLSATAIHKHQQRAEWLEWTTYGFAVVTLVVGFTDQRAGWVRGLLHGLLILGGLAVIILCVLTGEAGAQLVWSGVSAQ